METLERVIATDLGLRFELVQGELPAAEEDMWVEPQGTGSILNYRGRYRPRPGKLAWLPQVILVPFIYRREVSRSLVATKALAEARFSRSRTAR